MNPQNIQLYRNKIDEFLLEEIKSVEHDELYKLTQKAVSQGGKRIRPLLCLLAARMFGAEPADIIPQASAIELFHAFSLVHDDIMDEAPMRRGKPSIYYEYGRDKAILSGDVILIYAYRMLTRGLDPDSSHRILTCFNDTAVKVCEGQMMDMEFEGRHFPDQSAYMKMIEYKTSVLIGAALKIGAIAAGASAEDSERLYKYGVLQGLVFQIQDDDLDVYGDNRSTGKQVGGDIIQGKKTLLTILCAFKAGAEREKFESVFFDDQIAADKKVRLIKSAYEKFGVREDVNMIKNTLSGQANQILNELTLNGESLKPLEKFCSELMNRSH